MKEPQQIISSLKTKLRRESAGIVLLHEHPWTTYAMDQVISTSLASGGVFKHPLYLLSKEQIRAYDIRDCHGTNLHCMEVYDNAASHANDNFDALRVAFDKE